MARHLSRWRYTTRTVLRSPTAAIGVVVLAVLVLATVTVSFWAPFPPDAIDINSQFASPSWHHLLGADELGRDTLTRLIYGGRVSLLVSVESVALATVVGVLLGGMAATWGGWVQTVVMRVTDVFLAFPEILLAIVLMAVMGPSQTNIVLGIGAAYVPRFIRLSWSALLVVREQTYVEAARASGTRRMRLLARHMIPNIMPVLLVQITLCLGWVILVESSLSYLGLGVQPPTASWGTMISAAQSYIQQSPYLVIFPGVAIMLTVLALNFVGDALSEALDPRFRSEAGASTESIPPANPAAGDAAVGGSG
jgi:peptide/nickel transport system permease protein